MLKPGWRSSEGNRTIYSRRISIPAGKKRAVARDTKGRLSRQGSRPFIILGIDPGLRSTGFAAAEVDKYAGAIVRVLQIGTIKTEPYAARTVRKTSDHLRRAREQASAILNLIQRHDVSVIAFELSTVTPYTHPTFSFGVMTGIVATLERPIIQVLPHEVKLAASGNSRATKRDIIAWALAKTEGDNLSWPTSARANSLRLSYLGRNVTTAAEHPADALAAIEAALATEEFRVAVQMA